MTRGPISFMAKNHVASNILMLVLLIGGLIIGGKIKQEVFPETDLNMVSISVLYPGATPGEVEDAIVRPIEHAVSGVDDIKRLRGTAVENLGSVIVEVLEGGDIDMVLQDVKSEIDRITTFPEESEKPVISKIVAVREVITMIIYGDASERALLENAERIKDDLLAMPNITRVELGGYRPYEISIEVPEENLRKYNLRLQDVANSVRNASLDLAGGTIRTEDGDILIRTSEKRYFGNEFDSVAVVTTASGQQVLLKSIANVIDGFEEFDQQALFDGKRAVMLKVYRVGDQTPKEIADSVKEYISQREQDLPPSISLKIIMDWSELLQQRIDLLLRNGLLGLILVLITLSFFLEMRLAMMVASGIAISFLGAMMFMPAFGVSINMISLFAFLIILGVVVDDAIVVGENIFVHIRMGKPLLKAAIDGTKEVNLAVVFAGLTTIAAFGPLLFIGGFLGNFLGVVPIIVILVLSISLVEAFFILPSHLASRTISGKSAFWTKIENIRSKFDKLINKVIDKYYQNILKWALRNRMTTIALAIAILLASFGLISGGLVKFVMVPEIEADWVTVNLTMAPGTHFAETQYWVEYVEKIGNEVIAEYDARRTDGLSNKKHVYTLIGQQVKMSGPHGDITSSSSNLAQIQFMLQGPDLRTLETAEFAAKWRKRTGDIPGADKISFFSEMMNRGADIEIELSHTNFDQLLAASERLKSILAGYTGVSEIADSYMEGKQEIKLKLRPEASSLGITESDLGMQVRSAFYGAEALRIQRGQNEVKIMVRYPDKDRRTLETIDQMRIRTRSGMEVPFNQAAFIEQGRGFSEIKRTDRRRVVTVSAVVDRDAANATEIIAELKAGSLPQIKAEYPGLAYDMEGQSRDMRESFASLGQALIFGLILIYALLAIPFKSFFQPIIVMSAIPFGFIGALLGHVLLGFNVSMISLFGIVALTGVVVNSSLVLIDFTNKRRAAGMETKEAIVEAGLRRFRPIIMTALTTFFGLTPMILETDIQARFLVPMAVSLGFGVLFATAITLVLVPVMYAILEDGKRFLEKNGIGVEADEAVGEEAVL